MSFGHRGDVVQPYGVAGSFFELAQCWVPQDLLFEDVDIKEALCHHSAIPSSC
jgi:hypothetical protein